jgi:hypothetical protein
MKCPVCNGANRKECDYCAQTGFNPALWYAEVTAPGERSVLGVAQLSEVIKAVEPVAKYHGASHITDLFPHWVGDDTEIIALPLATVSINGISFVNMTGEDIIIKADESYYLEASGAILETREFAYKISVGGVKLTRKAYTPQILIHGMETELLAPLQSFVVAQSSSAANLRDRMIVSWNNGELTCYEV